MDRPDNRDCNLITLCKKCHSVFHSLDRWEKAWQEFKKGLLIRKKHFSIKQIKEIELNCESWKVKTKT